MPKPRKKSRSDQLFSISPVYGQSKKQFDDKDESDGKRYVVLNESLITEATNATLTSWGSTAPARPGTCSRPNAPTRDETAHIDLKSAAYEALERELAAWHRPEKSVQVSKKWIVQGKACLAVLAEVILVGTLSVENNSGGQCSYPLHGRVINTYRDCFREVEWSIVKLHLVGLPNMPPQVCLLVERLGGDAMQLRGPVAWQSSELQDAQAVEDGCRRDITLQFDCDALLDGTAAEHALIKFIPAAAGMGALVNIGVMRLEFSLGD